MIGNLFHHPIPHLHPHHFLRLVVIVLLVLLAYLLITDTAAAMPNSPGFFESVIF